MNNIKRQGGKKLNMCNRLRIDKKPTNQKIKYKQSQKNYKYKLFYKII